MPSPHPHDTAPAALPCADWRTRDMLTVHALFAALLIAVLPFSDLPAAGVFSFGVCCLYGVYILAVMPSLIFKYFIFWVAAVLNLLGVLACEYTVIELTELRCMSGFVGSLPLLALAWWAFFALLWLFEEWMARRSPTSAPVEPSRTVCTLIDLLATAALGLAALALFLTASSGPPAFVLGIDRFTYAERYSVVPSQFLMMLKYLMFACVLAIRYSKRSIGVAAVGLYAVYLYWIGTKYGDYLNILAAFLLVYSDKVSAEDVSRAGMAVRRNLLAAVAVLAAIVAFAVFYQSSIGGIGALEYLGSRLAQQGQLWWKTFDLCRGAIDWDLSVEFEGFFIDSDASQNVGSHHGVYGIMYLCAPQNVVDAKLLTGSRYTAAGHAVAFSHLGAVGCVAYSLLSALLVAVITKGLTHPLDGWQVFSIVVWGRLYFVASTVVGMFTIADFLEPLSIMCYAVLFCVWLLRLHGPLCECTSSMRAGSPPVAAPTAP